MPSFFPFLSFSVLDPLRTKGVIGEYPLSSNKQQVLLNALESGLGKNLLLSRVVKRLLRLRFETTSVTHKPILIVMMNFHHHKSHCDGEISSSQIDMLVHGSHHTVFRIRAAMARSKIGVMRMTRIDSLRRSDDRRLSRTDHLDITRASRLQ